MGEQAKQNMDLFLLLNSLTSAQLRLLIGSLVFDTGTTLFPPDHECYNSATEFLNEIDLLHSEIENYKSGLDGPQEGVWEKLKEDFKSVVVCVHQLNASYRIFSECQTHTCDPVHYSSKLLNKMRGILRIMLRWDQQEKH